MRVAEYCSCDKIVVQRRSEVRGAKVCDVSTIFDEVGGVVRQVLQRRRPRSSKKHGEAKNAGKLPKHFRDIGARAATLALECKLTPAIAGALDLALAGILQTTGNAASVSVGIHPQPLQLSKLEDRLMHAAASGCTVKG